MIQEVFVIKAWKNKKSAFWGLVTIVFIMLWPAIPLKGLDTWFATLTGLFPTNILYPLLAIISGSYTALWVYDRQVTKTCKVSTNKGAFAGAFGIMLGACPACIPALAFFLPLSATVTLSYYSGYFLLIAVILMLFFMYRMKAFQKI